MSSALSVVIAARDAESTIRDQLLALTAQPWPAGGEIIVADNGSTDSTAAIVLTESERIAEGSSVSISLVDCHEAPGAGHARNAGVNASTYSHIAFCDADDIVANGWVTAMTSALDSHVAVGGRLDLDRLNPKWVVQSRGSRLAADELPTFDGIFPVLSSCNFGIRRSTFLDVGGFDVTYLRGQDAELSLRLYERGIDAHFAPDAVVNYRLRTTLRSVFGQALGWGEANYRLRSRIGRPSRLGSSLRSWAWLATHIHHLGDRTRRARWIYIAGIRVGLLRGAIMRRTRGTTTQDIA